MSYKYGKRSKTTYTDLPARYYHDAHMGHWMAYMDHLMSIDRHKWSADEEAAFNVYCTFVRKQMLDMRREAAL